ncbi:MAG: glucosaminidase domain-containing protein [Bacteroidota bacterium]|nr:glucosaminidase domain-containing protein [Bacteroidota bacterium]
MIKNTILFTFLFFSIQLVAQSTQLTRDEYIRKFYKLAISEMKRSGIPASITLAQGCWESGNGNSRLATEANNHFGIKCKSEWRGKKIYHDDDASQECFRKYANAETSYIDHSNFLMSGSRYSFLFQLDPKDYVGWAHGLKKAGYATDPTYAQRLIKIIEEYKLHVYDEYVDNRQLASLKNETAPVKIQPSTLGKINSRHKIELRNGLRTVVVEEGDSYQSITKDLALKDWELHTYNDIEKDSKVRVNEILYIEAKYKKGNKDHKQHVAEDGDTMHYIAQRYALRMKPLLKRNRMKKGEEPIAGQIVYLRNKRPR